MYGGREFQSLGAEQLKALVPMVLWHEGGMDRRPTGDEHRKQEGVVLL